MYCENCGKKIEQGSQFCSNCGKQLASNTSKPKKNHTFLVLLIIGIFITCIGFISYEDSSKPVTDSSWKYTYQELEQKQQDNLEMSKVLIGVGLVFTIGAVVYQIKRKNK